MEPEQKNMELEQKQERSVFLPLPLGLKPSNFESLTKNRQRILISLLDGEKNLTQIVESIEGSDTSTTFKSLQKFEDEGLVKKSENRTYGLTKNGKLLSLIVLEPNGRKPEQIEAWLHKILKEDFGLEDGESTNIVESLRYISEEVYPTKTN